MERVTLHVGGMSCGHCINTIEGNVGQLNGVREVKVSLMEGTVNVKYEPESINLNFIKETIEDQGYEVE